MYIPKIISNNLLSKYEMIYNVHVHALDSGENQPKFHLKFADSLYEF